MKPTLKSSMMFTVLLAFLGHPLFAQPVWLQPRQDGMLSVEWFKPIPPPDTEVDFITGAYYAGIKFKMGPEIKFVGEVPFVYASGQHVGTVTQDGVVTQTIRKDYSKFLLGNVYAGIEMGSEERPLFAEMGVRIPTMKAEEQPNLFTASESEFWDYYTYYTAVMTGVTADIERYGAFLPLGVSGESNYFTAQALLNYQPRMPEDGLGMRLRGGPIFFVPTGKGNLEVGVLLTAQGIYKTGPLYFLLGYAGLAPVTADDFDASEDISHQLILGMSADFDGIIPGINLRVPLDDHGHDFVRSIVAFEVGIPLQQD